MKKSLRSSKTLSRSIITPFRSLENRHDTTLSENMYSSLGEDTIRRVQVEMDILRREFMTQREHRTADIVGLHQKLSELSKQNIQRFDSLGNIFTQIESNIDERLIKREQKIQQIQNNRIAVQSNIDFLFKKTWQIDTSIADLLKQNPSQSQSSFHDFQKITFDLKQQIDQMKQYLQKSDSFSPKPADQNIQIRMQAIQEELKQVIYQHDQFVKNDISSIHKIIKQHQDLIRNLTFKDDNTKMQNIEAYIDQQWQKRIQTKLSKIINSYNTNFQQLEDTNLEIKDILQQVINVNGNLSQKLLTVINGKLDISAFKESISSLSNQFTETLTLNYQKINEIRDKQYEVQHELRSLKEILQRHDFQKSHINTRSVQKQIDEVKSPRNIDEPFIVSPRNGNRRKSKETNCLGSKYKLSQLQLEEE